MPRVIPCLVCGRPFEAASSMSKLCSPECVVMRRRARVHGSDLPGLPPPTAPCEVCGQPAVRPRKTCSPECQRERKRQRWRAVYHAMSAARKLEALERRKRERQDDPDRARQADARAHARIMADLERREAQRRRARERYAGNAPEIQAQRRKRLAAMSDAELAEHLERQRAYCREHRHRVSDDPDVSQRYREAQRERRRRRRESELSIDAQAIGEGLRRRLDGEAASRPARPCEVCGGPIMDRRPNARTCTDECQRIRRRSRGRTP